LAPAPDRHQEGSITGEAQQAEDDDEEDIFESTHGGDSSYCSDDLNYENYQHTICTRVNAMAYLYSFISYIFTGGADSTPPSPRHMALGGRQDSHSIDYSPRSEGEPVSPSDGTGICRKCRRMSCGFHAPGTEDVYYRTEPLDLDKLDFLSVLGKGSFGTVVLFRWPQDKKLYAMKVRLVIVMRRGSSGGGAAASMIMRLSNFIACAESLLLPLLLLPLLLLKGAEEITFDSQAPNRSHQDGERDIREGQPPFYYDSLWVIPIRKFPIYGFRLLQVRR